MMENQEEKICTKCGRSKIKDLFYRSKQHKDGLHPWCKECLIVANSNRVKKYKEDLVKRAEINTYGAVNRRKHRQDLSVVEKEKLRKKELRKKWAQERPEYVEKKRKQDREKWKNNRYRHRANERKRERYKVDCLYRFRQRIRACIKRRLTDRDKTSMVDMLGCSIESLILHLGGVPSSLEQIDHICPVAQGKTKEEVVRLQHYSNLRLLEAHLNKAKSDSWTPEGEEMCRKLLGRDWIF